jgi:hypothetical protein
MLKLFRNLKIDQFIMVYRIFEHYGNSRQRSVFENSNLKFIFDLKKYMPLSPEVKAEILKKLKSALRKCSPPMVISKETEESMELM